jgi:hypothetical protein
MTPNGNSDAGLSATDLGFARTSWNVAVTGDFDGDREERPPLGEHNGCASGLVHQSGIIGV